MEKENVVVEETVEVSVEETLKNAEMNLKEFLDGYEQSLEERKQFNAEFNETLDRINKDQAKIAEDIARREKEVFEKEKALTLKDSGLEAFAEFVTVDNSEELADVVKKLTAIVNEIKVGAGYVPKENAKQSEYDVYAQKKDTKGMIGSKLANLFKSL